MQCGLDLSNLLTAAQLALHPADHQLWCQASVWDYVAFRLLQADGAIGRTGVCAVVGSNGVVDGEDDAVNRGAFEVGDGLGVGGGHGGVVVVWWVVALTTGLSKPSVHKVRSNCHHRKCR